MKIELQGTDSVFTIATPTGILTARLWIGKTEGGIECHALIAVVGVDARHVAAFEAESKATPLVEAPPEVLAIYAPAGSMN